MMDSPDSRSESEAEIREDVAYMDGKVPIDKGAEADYEKIGERIGELANQGKDWEEIAITQTLALTASDQRVEKLEAALESAAFALQRIEERLNPGKTGDPKGQWDTCLRIAQEELEGLASTLRGDSDD